MATLWAGVRGKEVFPQFSHLYIPSALTGQRSRVADVRQRQESIHIPESAITLWTRAAAVKIRPVISYLNPFFYLRLAAQLYEYSRPLRDNSRLEGLP